MIWLDILLIYVLGVMIAGFIMGIVGGDPDGKGVDVNQFCFFSYLWPLLAVALVVYLPGKLGYLLRKALT